MKVYEYGALPPFENSDKAREQMLLAHRYANKLTEIELQRRAEYRAAQAAHTDVAPLLANVERLHRTLDEALTAIALARKEAGKPGKKGKKGASPKQADAEYAMDAPSSTGDTMYSTEKDAPLQAGDHVTASTPIDKSAPSSTGADAPTRDAVKAIRAELKEARIAWGLAKKAANEDPEMKAAFARANEKAHEAMKKARGECGVFWGTYLIVEQAAQQARSGKDDPRFRRWRGEGHLAVQLQGGLDTKDVHGSVGLGEKGASPSEPTTESGVEVSSHSPTTVKRGGDKGAPSSTGAAMGVHVKGAPSSTGDGSASVGKHDSRVWIEAEPGRRDRVLHFRIGSVGKGASPEQADDNTIPAQKGASPEQADATKTQGALPEASDGIQRSAADSRAPIFASLRFKMHRELPPGKIKWVHLVLRRVADRERWLIQFVVDASVVSVANARQDCVYPSPVLGASVENVTAAIDVGWRLKENGDLRVAVLVDDTLPRRDARGDATVAQESGKKGTPSSEPAISGGRGENGPPSETGEVSVHVKASKGAPSSEPATSAFSKGASSSKPAPLHGSFELVLPARLISKDEHVAGLGALRAKLMNEMKERYAAYLDALIARNEVLIDGVYVPVEPVPALVKLGVHAWVKPGRFTTVLRDDAELRNLRGGPAPTRTNSSTDTRETRARPSEPAPTRPDTRARPSEPALTPTKVPASGDGPDPIKIPLDDVIRADIEAFLKQDLHLWQWQEHERMKVQHQRREIFRLFAVKVARRYTRVILEKLDLRDFAERGPVENDTQTDTRRYMRLRALACVSGLRSTLANACASRHVEILTVDPAFTTMDCHVCHKRNEFNAAPLSALVHTCTFCSASWDQDENAAWNLLDMSPQEPPNVVEYARKKSEAKVALSERQRNLRSRKGAGEKGASPETADDRGHAAERDATKDAAE